MVLLMQVLSGVPGLIKGDMVKKGAVVIDVGKCTHQRAQQEYIIRCNELFWYSKRLFSFFWLYKYVRPRQQKTINVVVQAVHGLNQESFA